MQQPAPIHIAHLLPQIDGLLISFLKSLSPEDWKLQSLAPKWKVKDVALHLLDGNLRALSMLRDNHFGLPGPASGAYEDMVQYLNQLNADWIQATRRLSPRIIVDLLESSGKEYCDYIQSLDPEMKATFTVDWAGEAGTKNWFHIAREYTEKWHHQQQIRLAVGKEDELLKHQWYFPYLDTSIRALPHHYRSVSAEEGTIIKFVFQGEKDKTWFLCKDVQWKLGLESQNDVNCEVLIKDEDAWKIFTKGMKREEAISRATIKWDRKLGLRIFELIAVMA